MGDTATAFRPVAGKRPAPAERPEPPAFPSRRRKAGRRHTRRGSAAEPGPGAGGGKPGRLPRPLEEGVGRCPARDAGLLVPAAPARRDAARSSSSGLPEGSAQSRGGRLRAATKAAGGDGLLGEAATGLPPPPCHPACSASAPGGSNLGAGGGRGASAGAEAARAPALPAPPGAGTGGPGRGRWARPSAWAAEQQSLQRLSSDPFRSRARFFGQKERKIQPPSHLRPERRPEAEGASEGL